ncbi:FHA domain-containing protein FHA2 [Canna indica]|uniref:FHA domain-containing protein FHA2 n=1 Tax=Canna indica TaxID=4628 RepID=A0AAQ3QBS4_9LILI|nr:FHA domain-containing protein FHA2 [Canna indica]
METFGSGAGDHSGDLVPGFAKLEGEEFEYYMQTYSIMLGRKSKRSTVDLDLTSLGGGMQVSRQHARLYFDFTRRHFALDVLGKHGCLIQGVQHNPGSPPVKLVSQDLIQIGEIKFYFLLPVRSMFITPQLYTHFHSPPPLPTEVPAPPFFAPPQPTEAPVPPSAPPPQPTEAPASSFFAPPQPTEAPVPPSVPSPLPTEVPASSFFAPPQPKEAPVPPSVPPPLPTEVPASSFFAPPQPTEAPVPPSVPPPLPTEVPASSFFAPPQPTEAPVPPSVPPPFGYRMVPPRPMRLWRAPNSGYEETAAEEEPMYDRFADRPELRNSRRVPQEMEGHGGGHGVDVGDGVSMTVGPTGILEKMFEASSRADREEKFVQEKFVQLEKDIVSAVVTLLSQLCGPGEWVPMAKIYAEIRWKQLAELHRSVWHHERVRKTLTSEGWSPAITKGRPWFGLLLLLRKYPERFVINTRSIGEVSSEFVSLVSLPS